MVYVLSCISFPSTSAWAFVAKSCKGEMDGIVTLNPCGSGNRLSCCHLLRSWNLFLSFPYQGISDAFTTTGTLGLPAHQLQYCLYEDTGYSYLATLIFHLKNLRPGHTITCCNLIQKQKQKTVEYCPVLHS